jgi:gamma-glutamyltranspeptidase / glutathione hydrolase
LQTIEHADVAPEIVIKEEVMSITSPRFHPKRLSAAAVQAALIGLLASACGGLLAQTSPVQSCNVTGTKPPFCSAVRGDRSEGWSQQGRSEVFARNGMVTTSQPLAADAALDILRAGGNAIDAAVAMAATLNLVEPMNEGIGGDLFAVIYVARENAVHVLNASGKAPSGATLAHYNSLGYQWDSSNWGPGSGMPGGILSVTVPGVVWGWQEVLDKYGTMTFQQVLQPAIDYATNGFPVSERISNDWTLPRAIGPVTSSPANCCTRQDPDSIATWYINGVKPGPGQIYRNPDLAKTFKLLQQFGRDVFYKGEIAQALVAKSTALGGTMTLDDLANYAGEWVTPAHGTYHGYDIFELPPPAQAWNTIEMLNILEACVPQIIPGSTLASLGPTNPKYWHLLVEAKKLSYIDLYGYNADPDFVSVPLDRLLSKSYAATLCTKMTSGRASTPGPVGTNADMGDTIVGSTADRWGNMVSWVNSNYSTFGSGITVPGYGFVLHNRGQLFTLDPKSPNLIAPQKRPYNTLSAAFVMQNNKPLMTLGLMGGDMQVQGHAQMLVNILDLGANVQASTDMARFYHNEVPNTLTLESQLYNLVGPILKGLGHNVQSGNGSPMGGYQALMYTPDPTGAAGCAPTDLSCVLPINGFYRAGSDHRKDGKAAGW